MDQRVKVRKVIETEQGSLAMRMGQGGRSSGTGLHKV